MKCNHPKCKEPVLANGFCAAHYLGKYWKKGKTKGFEDIKRCMFCDKPDFYYGLCKKHAILVKHGDRQDEQYLEIIKQLPEDVLNNILNCKINY